MVRRMVVMLVTMAALLSLIGFVKFRRTQAAMGGGGYQPPPEAVTTIIARQEEWQRSLSAIGTVAAVNGVTVSADLPGVVQKIAFASGDRVAGGTLLVQLDTRQEQAQLAAAEARLELTRLNLERVRGLRGEGVTSQADFDSADAENRQAQGSVGEIKASIDRKTIRAPFGGILGIRQVNLGQYLKSGDPVVPLQSLDPIYVNFDVPQQEIGRLKPGAEVRVAAEGVPGAEAVGRLSAIDSIVDESTRNARVQATFENGKARLRPGMFVTASVTLETRDQVVALPASAISYAPYGDSVFIVEDMKSPDGKTYRGVRQQFVKLGGARGDQIAVVSGIAPGAEVVTSGAFKLRNGAAVQVNNEVQPPNNPQPKPEDS